MDELVVARLHNKERKIRLREIQRKKFDDDKRLRITRYFLEN
jgi:hypothetical protein